MRSNLSMSLLFKGLFSLIFFTGLTSASMFAATITVNTAVDENGTGANCSLREAIESADTNTAFGGCVSGAVGSDTIVFSALFNTAQTIQVATELAVDTTMTITGPGANLLTIQNIAAAGFNSRPMRVFNTATVLTMSGVTITGGNTTGGFGGAGLYFQGSGNLTNVHVTGNIADGYGGGIIFETAGTNSSMLNCTVSNNSSNGSLLGGGGAGVDNSGDLTITSSTISGNVKTSSTANGGGIYHLSGNLTITNSTITDNRGDGAGSAGGVIQAGGTVTVRNTIIAANRNNATTPDVAGAFTSGNFNLIGNRGTATGFTGTADQTNVSNTNAGLTPLGFYTGQTPTHGILGSSFAFDKGNNFGFTTDQRGLSRPFDIISISNVPGGNGADIGAFEAQAPNSARVSISGRVTTETGQGIKGVIVQLIDQNNNVRLIRSGTFGHFGFSDVEVGQTYVISLISKRYEFDPMVISPLEDLTDLMITPRTGFSSP